MNHANYEIYIGKERAGGYATQTSFEKALKNVIAQYGDAIVHTSSPHHNRKFELKFNDKKNLSILKYQ